MMRVQWKFVTKALTLLLQERYGWAWNPTSLEIVAHGVDVQAADLCDTGTQQNFVYKHVNSMEAIGGVLCP